MSYSKHSSMTFPPYSMDVTIGTCSLCSRTNIPVVVCEVGGIFPGVCEPCALMVGWCWRQHLDAYFDGHVFEQEPTWAFALVVRPRGIEMDGGAFVPDLTSPYDVLMAGPWETPEGYTFELPGADLHKGETLAAAAAAGLLEETGISSWPTAMERLHRGYDARGKLIEVFLCRAYSQAALPESRAAGVKAVETKAAWKPWPIRAHAGMHAGFYAGVEAAFDARTALARAYEVASSLCQPMSQSAVEHVRVGLTTDLSQLGNRKLLEALSYVMSDEEKAAAGIILKARMAEFDRAAAETRAQAAQEEVRGGEGGEDTESGGVESSFGGDAEREGPS